MNTTAFALFLIIVLGTLVITYFASKKRKMRVSFIQLEGINWLAKWSGHCGDYMSAASFLGIAGAIALTGFDGFFYSIGFLVAYLVVLYLVAEPLRNLGKYTLADMIAARFDAKKFAELQRLIR